MRDILNFTKSFDETTVDKSSPIITPNSQDLMKSKEGVLSISRIEVV